MATTKGYTPPHLQPQTSMLSASEVAIPATRDMPVGTGFQCVELWYLVGVPDTYYPTKIAAEVAARERFPHEDCAQRYNRIYFRRFIREC